MKSFKPMPAAARAAVAQFFAAASHGLLVDLLKLLIAAEIHAKAAWRLDKLSNQRRQGEGDDNLQSALMEALMTARSITNTTLANCGVSTDDGEVDAVLRGVRVVSAQPFRCYVELCDESLSGELEMLIERWQEVLNARRS